MLALVALPACGTAQQRRDRPPVRPGGGVALERIGNFDEPTFVTAAPGFAKLLFVVE